MKRNTYSEVIESILFWLIMLVYAGTIGYVVFAAADSRAEGLYAEIGATAYVRGLTGNMDWKGDTPGANIQLYYEWDNQPWYLPDKAGYMHQSNWLNGFPFNNDKEDKLDQLFVSKRFKIR